MRVLILLIAAAVLLYAAAVGALALMQRRLIYPGAHDGAGAAGARAVPPGTEAVTVETADGERLYALWRAPAPGCPVVVSFHGNASIPEAHAERFAQGPWRSHGWGLLAPAYRGYRGSTGSPSEAGLLADGAAALAETARRAPGAPVLLHGHSLGAAVAVATASAGPVVGLYLEAPFDSLSALVRRAMPLVPAALLRDTYHSDRRLAGTRLPVLIVHGAADPVVPAEHGRRLADLAGARARFVPLPGDHVSILGARDAEAEELFRAASVSPCRAAAAEPAAAAETR